MKVQTETEAPQVQGTEAAAMSLGGLPIPNIDLSNIDLSDIDLSNVQDSLRGVTNFVQENPIASAAVALGAGVVLTSLYWDRTSNKDKG